MLIRKLILNDRTIMRQLFEESTDALRETGGNMSKICTLLYDVNRDGFKDQVCFDTESFKSEQPTFTIAFGTSESGQFTHASFVRGISAGDRTQLFPNGIHFLFRRGADSDRTNDHVTTQYTVQTTDFSWIFEPIYLRCPVEMAAQACFFVAAPEGAANIE